MTADVRSCVRAREERGTVCLGNDRIELRFDPRRNGALVSILDKDSGCDMVRDKEAPAVLWRAALRKECEEEPCWIESSAADFAWDEREKGGLALTWTGFPGRNLAVEVAVSLEAGSTLSAWRMAVRGLGADEVCEQLMCPIVCGLVKFGDPAEGETLVAPIQGEAYCFRNPYPVRDRLPLCSGDGPEMAQVGVGTIGGRYPGRIAMQMFAFHNSSAGLYLATHDAGQHVKDFVMGPMDECGDAPVLRISHLLPGQVGQDVAVCYDTVVGVFHGNWYDAADIYKAWATRQWWCEKKLWDRDISDWMREGIGGVFQMSNYHMPQLRENHSMATIADTVNTLAEDAGVPLVGLVFNWERGGAWTGPRGFFPPREGEQPFRDAMVRLREAGNYGMVYITGGQWYIRVPHEQVYDSRAQFDAEGRSHAVKDVSGNCSRKMYDWDTARLCPAEPYTADLTAELVEGCLDLGCTIVQIDNWPCAGAEACYDPAHDHPPGFGPWWSEAWGRAMAEVRGRGKARDPNCVIATEGISENFIPWLDLYDHRAGNMEYFGHYGPGLPMGGETIPLFNYVYNEYIGSYCAAYPECNRPEVLYWTRCLGKALTQGVIPAGGRYFPDPPEHNPVTIGFYKKIACATARECWPYIMFGEMVRAPAIVVPSFTAQYCRLKYTPGDPEHCVDPTQRHEVRDAAVQNGSFRGSDGSVAHIFVNVTEQPVAFDVELPAYAASSGMVDVARITDGIHEPWMTSVALPKPVAMEMTPLSIVVLIVTQA